METFREILLFFFKKLGLSLLAIGGFVAGVFCWGLAIYPFNLPYLLHLPAEQTDAVIGTVCGLLFTGIVTVSVRTKWCYEEDLFLEDGEKASLLRRIVTSAEFIADVIVFALYVLVLNIIILVPNGVRWDAFLLGTVILLIVSSLAFAVLDCLLYILARKKADRKLRKRER